MKRQLIHLIVILPVLSLFFSLKIYAQSGTGELPATPKPTPTPKPSTRGTRPTSPTSPAPTPVSTTLTFSEERNGKLDPKTSDKGAAGSLYEELILNAKSEDMITFRLESADSSIGLQILDKDNAEVAIARNPVGDFKINTPTGGVPADGEYRVRVTGAVSGKNAVPFKLKVNRVGLTPIAHAERFNKIYVNYRETDPTSVEDTVAKLEELGKEDPSRPVTFELLGLVYLYGRKDAAKAEGAMERAIKANGAAVVRISYDNQWRKMSKMRSGDFGFEDARSGWLRIRPGQLTLSDLSNKQLGSLNGQQIKEMSKIFASAYSMVTITAENVRRPYVFAPETKQQAEADLVIKLIQNHVMAKNN